MVETPENSDRQFLTYFNVLLRRRYLVLGFTVLLCALVAVLTARMQKLYSSAAVIEIRVRAPTVLAVDQVSDVGSQPFSNQVRMYFATQHRILQSRTVLTEALEKLRTEHGITEFVLEPNPVGALRKLMHLDPQPETNLVHVVVTHPDPEKAALYANTIADVYLEQNLSQAHSAATMALEWLDGKQQEYEILKLESDQAVHKYRRENGLIGFDERYNTLILEFNQLQESWNSVHTELIRAEVEYTTLQEHLEAGEMEVLVSRLQVQDESLAQLKARQILSKTEEIERASRYGKDHPIRLRLRQQSTDLATAMEEQVRHHMDAEKAVVDMLRRQEEVLAVQLAEVEAEVEHLDERQIELRFLKSEAERIDSLYDSLDSRMSEIDVGKVVQANNIRIVDAAIPPMRHVSPNMVKNLAMALFLGLIGGVLLALAAEYLDNSVQSVDELTALLQAPILGHVPRIDPANLREITESRDREIYAFTKPHSKVAELLRSVRTNVLFRTGQRTSQAERRTLLVTSAGVKEGKTFVSGNLGAIIALSGSRVLVIDADMRRPRQHKAFDIDAKEGLSNVLIGELPVEQAIIPTHVPNLDLLPAGRIPTNPAELLGSAAMAELVAAATDYQVVIIDSPPMSAVSDPLIISPLVDGVLLVVEHGRTPKRAIRQCVTQMRHVDSTVLGAVVNKIDDRPGRYGYGTYYDYTYRYYERDDEKKTRKKRSG